MNKKSINKTLECSDWEEIEAFKSFCLPETEEKIREKIRLSFDLEKCSSKQEEDFLFNDYSEMIEKSFYFYSPKIFQSKTDKNKKILSISYRKHLYVNLKTNEFILFKINSRKNPLGTDYLYGQEVLNQLNRVKNKKIASDIFFEMFSDFPSSVEKIEQMGDYGLSFIFKGSNSKKEIFNSAYTLINVKDHFFKDFFKIKNRKEMNSLVFILGNLFSQKKRIVFSKFIDLLGLNIKDFFLKSRTANLCVIPWLTKGINVDSNDFENKTALRKEWFLKLSWFSDVLFQFFVVPWKTDFFPDNSYQRSEELSSNKIFNDEEEKNINQRIEDSINLFLGAIDENDKEKISFYCSELILIASEILMTTEYNKFFYCVEKQNIKELFFGFIKSKNWKNKILFYVDNQKNKKFVFPHISSILKRYSRYKVLEIAMFLLSLNEKYWSKNKKEFYFILARNCVFEDKNFYLPLKVETFEYIFENKDTPSEIFDIADKFIDFLPSETLEKNINKIFSSFYLNNTITFKKINKMINGKDESLIDEIKDRKIQEELLFKKIYFILDNYKIKINQIKEQEIIFFNRLDKIWKDLRKSNFIDFLNVKIKQVEVVFNKNLKSRRNRWDKKISGNINNIFSFSDTFLNSTCLYEDQNCVYSLKEQWFDFLCLNNLARKTISINSKNKIVAVYYHQLSFLPVPNKNINYQSKEKINVFFKTKNEKNINLIKNKMSKDKSLFLDYEFNNSFFRGGIEIPRSKGEQNGGFPDFYLRFNNVSTKMDNAFVQPFWLLDAFSEIKFDF